VQRRARSLTHNAWGQWKYLWFNASDRYRVMPLDPFGPYIPGANLDRADLDTNRSTKLRPDPDGFQALARAFGGARPPAGFDFRSVAGYFDFGVPGFQYSPVPLGRGSTHVEAEDLGGSWPVSASPAGASGAGSRSAGAGGSSAPSALVRRMHVSLPGTYAVFVRALRGGGESRAVRVRLAGTDLAPTHAAAGGDAAFAWEKAGTVTLSPGAAVLEVHDAGDGAAAVDAIAFSDDPSYEPK
jgi:hypothetical protein